MSDAITDMWRSPTPKLPEYPSPELQELARSYCEKHGIKHKHLETFDWLSISEVIFKIKNKESKGQE